MAEFNAQMAAKKKAEEEAAAAKVKAEEDAAKAKIKAEEDAAKAKIKAEEDAAAAIAQAAEEEARAKEQAAAAKAARLAGMKQFTPEERAAADAVTAREIMLADARRRAQQRFDEMQIWSWSDNGVPRTMQLWREEMARETYAKIFAEEMAKVELEAVNRSAALADGGGTKRGRGEEEAVDAKRARSEQ